MGIVASCVSVNHRRRHRQGAVAQIPPELDIAHFPLHSEESSANKKLFSNEEHNNSLFQSRPSSVNEVNEKQKPISSCLPELAEKRQSDQISLAAAKPKNSNSISTGSSADEDKTILSLNIESGDGREERVRSRSMSDPPTIKCWNAEADNDSASKSCPSFRNQQPLLAKSVVSPMELIEPLSLEQDQVGGRKNDTNYGSDSLEGKAVDNPSSYKVICEVPDTKTLPREQQRPASHYCASHNQSEGLEKDLDNGKRNANDGSGGLQEAAAVNSTSDKMTSAGTEAKKLDGEQPMLESRLSPRQNASEVLHLDLGDGKKNDTNLGSSSVQEVAVVTSTARKMMYEVSETEKLTWEQNSSELLRNHCQNPRDGHCSQNSESSLFDRGTELMEHASNGLSFFEQGEDCYCPGWHQASSYVPGRPLSDERLKEALDHEARKNLDLCLRLLFLESPPEWKASFEGRLIRRGIEKRSGVRFSIAT